MVAGRQVRISCPQPGHRTWHPAAPAPRPPGTAAVPRELEVALSHPHLRPPVPSSFWYCVPNCALSLSTAVTTAACRGAAATGCCSAAIAGLSRAWNAQLQSITHLLGLHAASDALQGECLLLGRHPQRSQQLSHNDVLLLHECRQLLLHRRAAAACSRGQACAAVFSWQATQRVVASRQAQAWAGGARGGALWQAGREAGTSAMRRCFALRSPSASGRGTELHWLSSRPAAARYAADSRWAGLRAKCGAGPLAGAVAAGAAPCCCRLAGGCCASPLAAAPGAAARSLPPACGSCWAAAGKPSSHSDFRRAS